jgi:hypothetical protein
MWTNSWQFVLILRYVDECCTDRKFNSYFTSISQMPGNCQTLVSLVVGTVPILSLSLSHLLPTLPSPFPWQFVSLMRSYSCLVLCVVEVISHCYMVDMVTCCLIRYSQLKLESSFPPICYLILICFVCNIIDLFTIFMYLFIIVSAGVATFHPHYWDAVCVTLSNLLVFVSRENFFVLIAGTQSASSLILAQFLLTSPFALKFRILYLLLIFLKWSQPQNKWAVSSHGGCMTFGLYNNVVWATESVSCQMIWENCHIC